MSRQSRATRVAGGIALVLLFAGCGSKDSGTGPGGGTTQGANTYLQGLPSWSAFSPVSPDVDSAEAGAVTFTQDTIAADSTPTATVDSFAVQHNVVYACTETPYSATRTPKDLVMYSPNEAYLWPGAFIQGASHRDGSGSVLPLVIDERAPINVSIPSLPTGQNFRTVNTVNQSAVASAIGDMIGNAVIDSLNTGSTSFFRMESYRSEQEFALKVGISGRYLGFKARTQVNSNTHGQQSMVSVQFLQRMYEVVVAPPSTPGGWFTGDFTQDKLQQQITLHRIGPDNLPVYISKVVYGRMMMFTMKANASESELKGIVQASYNALGNGVAASLSAKQKNILSESEVEIFSLGGADSATASMIRTGDWRSYFTVSAPLSTAKPLAYTFTNMADNHDADVTETTNYTERNCQALSNVAGQLKFLAGQNIAAPVPSPYEVKLADVNGDGRSDLIWNYRSPTSNQIAVSLAGATGVFGTPATYTSSQSAPPEGWGNFNFRTGDVTGDGRADLIWDYEGPSVSKVYIGEAQSGGGFAFDAPDTVVGAWTGYQLSGPADMDGDGIGDLVWNRLTSTNSAYVGISKGNGTFERHGSFSPPQLGWTPYHLFLEDINRDGRTDFIWNNVPISNTNRTYTGISQPNAAGITYSGGVDHSTICCWNSYQPVVADFDGDQVADIYWYLPHSSAGAYIHRFRGNGSGGWTQLSLLSPGKAIDGYDVATGDLNGDGRADMIWTYLSTDSAHVRTGISDAAGVPNIAPVEQVVPAAASFSGGLVLIGKVDADGRDDVVWVLPQATTQIFVGLAQP